MADFLNLCKNIFDLIGTAIVDVFESISTFVIAIANINASLGSVVMHFPTFIGGVLMSAFVCKFLLRLIGR